jgi:hypothetical protein
MAVRRMLPNGPSTRHRLGGSVNHFNPSQKVRTMSIKQLTVLTGSSLAELGRVISGLSGAGLDIRAHCLVDNGDGYCKLRMIVSEPDKAVEILQENNIAVVVNEVLMVETDDRPGGLSRLFDYFREEDILLEYTYTAASDKAGTALMVFRFSDNAKAAAVLEKNGLKLLGSRG